MSTTEIRSGEAAFGSQDLLSALEPEQLTSTRRTRLPRRYLKPWQLLLLWSLRLYLLFMIVVVVYQIFASVD